jgi:LEA14-like dessication related protein
VRIQAVAAALSMLLLSSCALVQLEPPRLQVIDASLLSADVFRQELRLRMRVHNPNDIELPVRGITYELQVAGETFANGESERDFVVPALDSSEFSIDVTTNAAAALLRVLGNRDREPTYRVTGKVRLAKGLVKSIPFEHSGTLRLR